MRNIRTRLHQAVDRYLELRRALGFKLYHETWWLPDFASYLERCGSPIITIDLALKWAMQPAGVDRSWWGRRLGAVRQFARHHRAIDPRTEIPSSDLIPFRTPRRTPYLYTSREIAVLMLAAQALPHPILATCYATLIGLLATTGMRVSEALRLDDSDVDWARGLLVIRGAKFNKTREVPLHPSTLTALTTFMHRRDRQRPHRRTLSLFISTTGVRIRYSDFRSVFRRLVATTGIGGHLKPRIHDMRHSFAVTILRDWYRAKLDVDPRLPLLSTYLGHVSPKTTYWYLTATPELVALAAKRLEQAWEGRS
jgi:integrase